jgi:hypothetical protein
MPRIHFIAMIALIFLGISTNTAAAGIRGQIELLEDYKLECPLEIPANGSDCESVEEEKDGKPEACYFNFVKTPGPSPEENNFVPSIACSCNDDTWVCGVAPEYLKALSQAMSG